VIIVVTRGRIKKTRKKKQAAGILTLHCLARKAANLGEKKRREVLSRGGRQKGGRLLRKTPYFRFGERNNEYSLVVERRNQIANVMVMQ